MSPNDLINERTSAFKAHRHGFAGHVAIMTPAQRAAHDLFVGGYIESLLPVGTVERDFAESVAEDAWRLKRASADPPGIADPEIANEAESGHFRYGSRVRLSSSPAPLLETALVRLHVEQAIYGEFLSIHKISQTFPGVRTVREGVADFVGELPCVYSPAFRA